jgi:acyl-CoA synthetase (AMP-forming)/AMP-acid ligase II
MYLTQPLKRVSQINPHGIATIFKERTRTWQPLHDRVAKLARGLRNGWVHPGDAAYMDGDGFIFIADRLKDMIVSGGENLKAGIAPSLLGKSSTPS